jgi:hypothetical protein
MGRWETARAAAWDTFGRRYWRWFVFGPLAARAFGVLVVLAGLFVAARYVALHAKGWLGVLGWLVGNYLLPMILVSVGVTVYAIVAVIVWRTWGWLWKIKGISTVAYTFSIMLLLVGSITLIGVSL